LNKRAIRWLTVLFCVSLCLGAGIFLHQRNNREPETLLPPVCSTGIKIAFEYRGDGPDTFKYNSSFLLPHFFNGLQATQVEDGIFDEEWIYRISFFDKGFELDESRPTDTRFWPIADGTGIVCMIEVGPTKFRIGDRVYSLPFPDEFLDWLKLYYDTHSDRLCRDPAHLLLPGSR